EWSSACLAGRSYFRITPQGLVTPCPYLPQAVGDLRREKLADIWANAPELQALRHTMPGGKCGGCDYRVSCGGCRARAFATTGDLMGEDAKCGYVKASDAAAEQPPAAMEEMAWAEDAERVLERIPGFVRARVRGMIEKKARAEGIALITAEFMSHHRPPATVMARFGRG
ncbi:MAG: SPASM domain-containing protein, partial [Pseudomonadota bacterium]|nr:SPASM domain-containing protein [Pseudomonadota bacterium]